VDARRRWGHKAEIARAATFEFAADGLADAQSTRECRHSVGSGSRDCAQALPRWLEGEVEICLAFNPATPSGASTVLASQTSRVVSRAQPDEVAGRRSYAPPGDRTWSATYQAFASGTLSYIRSPRLVPDAPKREGSA